jgi:GNAT superfamily N-acetyltransferase
MESNVIIRKANDTDIPTLLSIYLDKVKWLNDKNIPMWDPNQFTIENLKGKYVNPEYFICCNGQTIVGGFLLIEYDERYWKDKKENKAFYFHKFVVRKGFTGKGYADFILEWVKKYSEEQGKEYVRLDYEEAREYLKNMYIRHGFKTVDRIRNQDGAILVKGEYKIK